MAVGEGEGWVKKGRGEGVDEVYFFIKTRGKIVFSLFKYIKVRSLGTLH